MVQDGTGTVMVLGLLATLNLQRVKLLKLGLQQDYGYSCATWWRSCNRDKSSRGKMA